MTRNKVLSLIAPFLLIILAALILAPPPQDAQAQFVAQQLYGGASGGSANAQTIVIRNWSSNMPGVPVQFVPSVSNTSATVINVSGLGNIALKRPTNIGLADLSGGELQSGVLTTIMYTGSVWQLISPLDTRPVGSTIDLRGPTTPPGYLIEDGSCVSRAQYAALYTVIGTTYGACDGSTTFAVPDSRGTVFAALDNQGGNGNANRITSGGSGCAATSLGSTVCGAQSATLNIFQIPVHNHNVYPYDPGHFHLLRDINGNTASALSDQPGSAFNGPTGSVVDSRIDRTQTVATGLQLWSGSGATGVQNSTSNAGGGQAHAILNPILLGRRAIKY